MSTRKLIVVALLCGLAILVAGGIQLLRISDTSERTVELLSEGDQAVVGGVEVTVVSSERDRSAIRVTVEMASVEASADVPTSSFSLLVGGDLEQPLAADGGVPPACGASVTLDGEPASCVVVFPPGRGTASLSFSRGGEQRVWRLDPDPA